MALNQQLLQVNLVTTNWFLVIRGVCNTCVHILYLYFFVSCFNLSSSFFFFFFARPAEAVLTEANVEPYLPDAWTEQETGVLEHLVGIYGPTHWSTIAAGVATKSETQVQWGSCPNMMYTQ